MSNATHRLPPCPVVEPQSLRSHVEDAEAGPSEIYLPSFVQVLILPHN